MRAPGQGYAASLPLPIGHRAVEIDHQAVFHPLDIRDVESHQLRTPEAAGETQDEQRALAGALQTSNPVVLPGASNEHPGSAGAD